MGEHDYDVKKGLLAAGIAFVFGVLWFLGNMVIPTIVPSLNIIAVLLSAVVIFIVPFYASGVALRADNRHKAPGGHMRGIGDVGLIVGVVIFAVALISAAYLMQPKAQSLSQAPVTAQPAPAATSPLSTATYSIRGLASFSGVQGLVCPAFPTAQTPVVKGADYDQGSAVTVTSTAFSNPNTGALFQGSTSTPGQVISYLVNASGYMNDVVTLRTGCGDTGPVADAKMKAYDSSVTMSAINSGLTNTANAITAGSRAVLAASSDYTFTVGLAPSAKNKHIAGGDVPAFAVLWNTTSLNSFTPSQFSAHLGNGFAQSNCVPISLPSVPTAYAGMSSVMKCTGDFDGQNVGTYSLSYTVHTSSSYAAGTNLTNQIAIIPFDYFQQVTAVPGGAAKGSIQTGPVKDDGTAIQTGQSLNVYTGTSGA